ncbi:MAG TPA: hypothetical protein P5265_05170 [Bacteroidia bacterium]|nr:hypothetical protein [Bacteroidia bacterium]
MKKLRDISQINTLLSPVGTILLCINSPPAPLFRKERGAEGVSGF